jgi:hypothetical protein
MSPLTRRRFVAAAAASALISQSRLFAQSAAPVAATLTLHPDRIGASIPEDFIGLSYEIQQLSDPSFFSTANTGLIAQFRALAPKGVLRLGGNTSDVGWWKPTPESKQPPLPPNVLLHTPKGAKSPMELSYAVTPEAVRNLRGFLDATGWTTLFGINLGTNTPALAAEEAVFVAKTLGPKLEYFQVGNEPDGFPSRFRDRATWSADRYFDDWLAAANAIRARVPNAKFGLPDTAGHTDWATVVAGRLAALPEHDRPEVAAITHHYYFTGPPSNPKATLDNLLRVDPRVSRDGEIVQAAAAKLGATYRMTEGNTCYRGGKPGFSDVFGAALWAADYALTLASLGYAGLNLHGGGGKAVADSLGGTLPGELLMADPKAPHPRPFYTPIAYMDGKYVAEPVYFGLKFAQHFAGARLMGVDFAAGSVNATAYAAKTAGGRTAIAIINKDPAQAVRVGVEGLRQGTIFRLNAPSLEAHEARLREDGRIEHARGAASLEWSVPAGSATLVIG